MAETIGQAELAKAEPSHKTKAGTKLVGNVIRSLLKVGSILIPRCDRQITNMHAEMEVTPMCKA